MAYNDRYVYFFKKTFDSLYDAVEEIVDRTSYEELKDIIFGKSDNDHVFNSINDLKGVMSSDKELNDYIIGQLCKKIMADVPFIENEEWPNCYAINVNADQTYFHTKHYSTFGWRYEKLDDGQYMVNFMIKLITPRNRFLVKKFDEQCKDLKELGWKIEKRDNLYRRKYNKNNNDKVAPRDVKPDEVLEEADVKPVINTPVEDESAKTEE